MKKELCINGFSEVSEMEMINIDASISREQVVTIGVLACVGIVGSVCTFGAMAPVATMSLGACFAGSIGAGIGAAIAAL